MTKLCPCGSEIEFSQCCEPLLNAEKDADTAEALMRSRYVAFTTINVEYLMRTHHASNRPNKERNNIKKWAKSVQWVGLTIIKTEAGKATDENGYVEFRATYIEKGNYERIHEKSYFEKEDNKWYYLGGMDIDQVTIEKMFYKPL